MMKQTFILLFFLLTARVRSLEAECNLLIFSNIDDKNLHDLTKRFIKA